MFIRLFANCFLTKGFSKSIIVDSQRQVHFLIPNDLYGFLKKAEKLSVDQLYKIYGDENRNTIDEYISFLNEKDLIIKTESKEQMSCFPEIKKNFSQPFEISNIIIDISSNNLHNLKTILNEINILNIAALQIRAFEKVSISIWFEILEYLITSSIRDIQLLIHYDEDVSNIIFEQLINTNLRISEIIIHSSPINQTNFLLGDTSKYIYIKKLINSSSHCGVISSNHFAPNLNTYLESLKHNTCLNGKISIDANGEIKNCPSMQKSYGNIKNTSLISVLKNEGFKTSWLIKKGFIDVCKICEYRNICTDCRAFIQDPSNVYSKPLKCGYNPYTGVWENWENSPLNKNAIIHYGLQELQKATQNFE